MQIDYNDMVRVCTLKYTQSIHINLEADKKMELNDFKDWLFELMNEGDESTFGIKCKELSF